MGAFKVGGDVDAYCGRCKMELRHTILALVASEIARVRCNTCGSDHVYRGKSAPSSSSKRSSSTGSAPSERPKKTVVTVDELLATRDLSKAKPYSIKTTFAVDDVISHPTFGLGIVSAVRGDKVDVTFKLYEKTLIHGRGPVEAPPNPA
jgi:hypothetical protein